MRAKIQIYAVDDNKQTIIDIQKAAKKHLLPAIKDARTEEDGLRLVGMLEVGPLSPLFLIDLKLKDKDSGFRIVRAIRERAALRYAPIVVVTSSPDQEYINKSYELGANCYVVKNDDPKDFNRTIDDLVAFWSDAAFYRKPKKKRRR